MENTLQLTEHLANNAKEKLSEKQAFVSQLERETETQKPKLERVTKQCAKLVRDIRLLKQTKDETLEEQDIKLREVKQFHKVIDEMLADCIEEHAPISFILQTHFKQTGLQLPIASHKGSHQNSTSSSQVSLVSVKSSRSSINTSASQASVKVLELNLPDPSPVGSSSRPISASSSANLKINNGK